jgi:hypothetical protein
VQVVAFSSSLAQDRKIPSARSTATVGTSLAVVVLMHNKKGPSAMSTQTFSSFVAIAPAEAANVVGGACAQDGRHFVHKPTGMRFTNKGDCQDVQMVPSTGGAVLMPRK